MQVGFDPIKNEKNFRERGLSFERVAEVDFNKEHGETHYIALCYLEQRLHVQCFTETEAGIRVISFRKANEREAKRYGKAQILDS